MSDQSGTGTGRLSRRHWARAAGVPLSAVKRALASGEPLDAGRLFELAKAIAEARAKNVLPRR